MADSLWGEEFSIQETPLQAKKIITKINNPKDAKVSIEKAVKSKSVSLDGKLSIIYSEVDRILWHYKENTQIIYSKEELYEYISFAIKNGVIAVDTETNNSLDPISCKLMGLCLYTPNRKNVYVPVNHIDRRTGEKLSNQVAERAIKEELERIKGINIIMHNGKFDYEVLKCTCDVECIPTWDTMIAAKILNENEPRAGLKEQYIDKIDNSQEKYSIDHLFENVDYAVVDPDVFALYAATDSYMTYKLYEWQLKEYNKPENEKLLYVLRNIEMPVVQVAAEMELTGVEIDKDYSERLSVKYHKLVSETDTKIANEIAKYSDLITDWRKSDDANYHANKNGKIQKSKNEQLKDPIEVTSPTQLAILLYDIMKVPVIDKTKPRGTGEDILLKIDNPICKLILEKRGYEKLINTYIDKLPSIVSEKDGRLHAHFNQVGTDTGRFSSSDPNLQNIPSHNKEIRMMFKAANGCVFCGSDFSQQEPRLLSAYSMDKNMIQAYKDDKDLYAMIASKIYNNNYDDNREFYPDGTPNPEGKKRRTSVKSLLLGIMYGLGAASLAEKLGIDIKGAQKIIDDFYVGFPAVKKWMDETDTNARKYGYVEDFWGRRRRLPDIQKERYEVISNNVKLDFNPILFTKGITGKVDDNVDKYKQLLSKAKSRKDIESIKSQALLEGITIKDNSGFVSRAERQCVNARVQGGAASMSKIAMRKIFDNEELRKLGFKLVLQIHDEVIGEVPEENAEQAGEILSQVMRTCVEKWVKVPFKCDVDISPCWYYNDFKSTLKNEFEKLKGKVSLDKVVDVLCDMHGECTREQILDFLS